MKVYINSKFVDEQEAKISIFNYGFLYGYGVYENIRVYNGRIFRLKEHLVRLLISAKNINLIINITQRQLEQAIIDTLLINNLDNAIIKIILTVKCHPNSINKSLQSEYEATTLIIIATEENNSICCLKQELNGINVISYFCSIGRYEFLIPNTKSISYLNNILAKMEADKHNAKDAILLNHEGNIIGCSSSNIFIVKDEIIYTPSSFNGALNGITRETVIELARNKLKFVVQESKLNIYNIYNADECFCTSTTNEIIPIVNVDLRDILYGKPGEITVKIIKEFTNLVMSTGTPIR
ncbi:MAG: aminotransferase class IV [Endomicrobium sp.]|jgi:branched-chain amino acid aminotransferase|nr:aminotransferase class IV [Endomicrobium sp.]